ncbi:MAG: homoserine O-succinyltransferase [Oscillospiraceae bacterium]
MPIKIPANLPAREILNRENVFIMDEGRAISQDIRPLRIIILNLMPKKVETETQLLRLLGNSPIQIEVELMQTATHVSRNTSSEHLLQFYKTFDEVKHRRYDALIITGAPVEQLDFEDVDYWPELCDIMDWTRTNVFSTLYICWGAQAAMYHFYGVPKHPLQHKLFGVFEHTKTTPRHDLLYGFDDVFYVPHSRHTEVRAEDIALHPELEILSTSEEAGVYITASRDGTQFFVSGHSEYDRDSLAGEYFRDLNKGLPIQIPANYFQDDDPAKPPRKRWRAHSNLLFSNWVNYFVYQKTPFDYIY